MAYSTEVLARVREPRRVGALPREEASVGTGEAGSLDRGPLARLAIRVDARARRIDEARFKVFGCSAAIASASLVSERLEGAFLHDARALSPDEIIAQLDLPADRAAVADLVIEAARRAMDDWERKQRT
jgi:nitrogen fixation NifU-like protein